MERRNEESLYQSVLITKKKYPKRYAFYYRKKYYTYEFLISRICSFEDTLKTLGFNKNDVITICLPNVPEALYLFYATNKMGGIANIIHPLMGSEEVKEIVRKTNSRILFILDTRYSEVMDLNNENIKVYSVSPVKESSWIIRHIYKKLNKKSLKFLKDKNFESLSKFYKGKVDKEDEFVPMKKEDAVLLHSGGTTGKPKTVALSSFTINSLVTNIYEVLDYKDGDYSYMLSVLPMFHGFGLAICIHILLAYGGCDMLMPKFNTKETINLLNEGKINYIVGVPTLFEALVRKDEFSGEMLKNLKGCFVGGDFVSSSLKDRFNKKMMEAGAKARLFEGYGLTETVCVNSVNTSTFNKPGTVGKPLKNVKAMIIDEEENDLGVNVEGEIAIGGETLMNGYRYEKEKVNIFFEKDGIKYLHTGDYGFIDEEGYLHFKQRMKRLLKINGVNIFPSEVEEVVSLIPHIYECAAIGIKDDRYGDMVKLFVVLDRNNNLDLETLKSNINEEIVKKCSIYAKPKEIVFIDKLPKTLLGKVDVKVLK